MCEAAEAPRDTRRPLFVVTECPNVCEQAPKDDEGYEDTAPERNHCEDERRDAGNDVRITAGRGHENKRPRTKVGEKRRHRNEGE